MEAARRRDAEVVLSVRGLSKSFGGTVALDAVDLQIRAGEVHALVGQNGSGKSTLIKVLSGYHSADAGSVAVLGGEVSLPLGPPALRELGTSFVHQDLGLVPSGAVLENLRVGRYQTGPGRNIRWRSDRQTARKLLAGHDEVPYLIFGAQRPKAGAIKIDGQEWTHPAPDRSKAAGVALLPADRQGQSAIPSATVRENVTLPNLAAYRRWRGLDRGRERADIRRDLKRFAVRPPDPERRLAGTSVLYSSVEYEDLANVCDRVLVFRRGRIIGDLAGDALSADRLAERCYSGEEAA